MPPALTEFSNWFVSHAPGKLETHVLGNLSPAHHITLCDSMSSPRLHTGHVSHRREQSWTGLVPPVPSLGSQCPPTNDSHTSALLGTLGKELDRRGSEKCSHHVTSNKDGLPRSSPAPASLTQVRDVAEPLPFTSLTVEKQRLQEVCPGFWYSQVPGLIRAEGPMRKNSAEKSPKIIGFQ